MSAHRRGILLCLASAAGFGSMAILASAAYDAGATIPDLLVVRFLLAAVGFWALVRLTRAAVPAGLLSRKMLALGAIGYSAQAALFFAAVSRLDAALAALLLYLYPFLVFAISVALGRERLTTRRAIPLVAAGAGVMLVLGAGAGGSEIDLLGVACAIGAALVYTGYILVADGLVADSDPLAVSALAMTGAAATCVAAGLATGSLSFEIAPSGWLWLLILALGSTVVGVAAFFSGLRLVGPSTAAIVSTAEPVVTVALAFALLGEHLTGTQLAGGAAVLASVVLLQRSPAVSVAFDAPPAHPADRAAAGAKPRTAS